MSGRFLYDWWRGEDELFGAVDDTCSGKRAAEQERERGAAEQ